MHDFYRIVSAFYWTKFHSSRLLVTFMTFRNKTQLDYCRKSVPTSQLHYRGTERDIEKSRRLRSVERLDLYPSEIPMFLSCIHYEIRVILCKFFYPLKSRNNPNCELRSLKSRDIIESRWAARSSRCYDIWNRVCSLSTESEKHNKICSWYT